MKICLSTLMIYENMCYMYVCMLCIIFNVMYVCLAAER